MITVKEAEALIQSTVQDYGTESIPFDSASGRVLAEDIKADRDLPPYNRVAMDGIAIRFAAFEKGLRKFKVKHVQAAGDQPSEIQADEECIEIMTGAALPASADTVIRYEDLHLADRVATIVSEQVIKGQSIHAKGSDKKHDEIVVQRHRVISPAVISVAVSAGKSRLVVKKMPSVLIISTGNELVDVHESPSPYQIRRSNNYMIRETLKTYGLHAVMAHLPDDESHTKNALKEFLGQYDVILLSGGISMGKFDYVPEALEASGVKKLFHKVQQRPGKPFWFGKHENGALIFAFPGNPVSTFMCLQRYFLPWLEACLQLTAKKKFAVLDQDVFFKPPLQYFLQVQLNGDEKGRFIATPLEGNGSGDFANLTATDAFMELPLERDTFKKGDVFRIWMFRS
jgi:molybdopterin molybdotransferase